MSKAIKPFLFDISDAMAVKALAAGTADAHAQQRALKHVLRLCGTGKLAYVPDSERDTAFALGQQSVGYELMLYVQEHADSLRKIAEGRSTRRT